MDIDFIREVVTIVEESGIGELEIEEEGVRIRVAKVGGHVQIAAGPMPMQQAMPQTVPAADEAEEPVDSNLYEITAPMVGTFYRAPSPESPAFVRVGDDIDAGTVVCILESMKVMNEIKAGASGKVVEICVENAQAVEFGQPLLKLKVS